jgi:hypothetical protein
MLCAGAVRLVRGRGRMPPVARPDGPRADRRRMGPLLCRSGVRADREWRARAADRAAALRAGAVDRPDRGRRGHAAAAPARDPPIRPRGSHPRHLRGGGTGVAPATTCVGPPVAAARGHRGPRLARDPGARRSPRKLHGHPVRAPLRAVRRRRARPRRPADHVAHRRGRWRRRDCALPRPGGGVRERRRRRVDRGSTGLSRSDGGTTAA